MDSSARVLQVVLSLDPGGTERLVLELIARLQNDIPMAVCCLDQDGQWAEEARRSGAPVTSLNRHPGFHPALGRGVAAAARAHRATVVHAHHYSPFVYAALGKAWGGPPVVYTEHGRLSDAPASAKRRLANRVLAAAPARVFTVSENLRQHLAAEGWPASQVGVIYNGVDPDALAPASSATPLREALGVADEVLLLATVARLDPVKDLGTLLDAVASLVRHRPAVLAMAGDGPDRTRLEHRVRELGLASSVRFLGYRDDVNAWLGSADVYVNSSISEGISLTILEAMGAGVPVVATRVGGTPEIVDESCGRLVPARSAAALCSALADLASDADRRRRLGAAGRSRVLTRFTNARMVGEYAGVYREVTAGRRA
jgi:glycosyltransferase involved in cell wall biosynthesis